ncbi:MAG: PQQ-dependent sugar dehydrogenase [Acidimicrobiales bacterium]
MARRAALAVVLAGLLAWSGCDERRGRAGPAIRAETVATLAFDDGAGPTALAELSDGRLVVGERRTGRILAFTGALDAAPEVLAVVDVDPQARGQRGLLGLATIGRSLFASWTRAGDGRLVVGLVRPGPTVVIWEGPVSSDLANGGHLAVAADDRLVVGIGDLRRPELIDDPASLNGKVLSLDPDGPLDQRPLVLSGGWNNPFALTVADGTVWVADNAPGRRPERIGRAEVGRSPVDLPGRRAPSALVSLGANRLGLCGFLDGDLVEVDVTGPPSIGATVVKAICRTGALALADGSLAVSDGTTVRVIRVVVTE